MNRDLPGECMAAEGSGTASVYKHETEAVQRPDVGVEAQFSNKKTPKTYRYDSSLAPELVWDENGERDFAEGWGYRPGRFHLPCWREGNALSILLRSYLMRCGRADLERIKPPHCAGKLLH